MTDEMRESKRCPSCGEVKLLAEFGSNKQAHDGKAFYCKACVRANSKAAYRKRQAAAGKIVNDRNPPLDVPDGWKYCANCKEIKPIGAFGKNRATRDGMTAYCKPCHNEISLKNRIKNHGSSRNYLLKLRYGLTEEEVDAHAARVGGICVICLRGKAAHVDHSHETGLFRGLLCFSCNGALGQFEDNAWRMRSAATYLEILGPHWCAMVLEIGPRAYGGIGGKRRLIGRMTYRDRSAGARKYHIWQKYGLEEADVQELRRVQRDLCAICFDGPAEHIDHDHRSGRVRGLLCPGCNTGMGQFRDDPATLRRGADYVAGRLVREEGGRLSFTFPDVDPAAAPAYRWRVVRQADGEHRRAVLELAERAVFHRGGLAVMPGALRH